MTDKLTEDVAQLLEPYLESPTEAGARRVAQAAIRVCMEAAAKVAESKKIGRSSMNDATADDIAAAIRALANQDDKA